MDFIVTMQTVRDIGLINLNGKSKCSGLREYSNVSSRQVQHTLFIDCRWWSLTMLGQIQKLIDSIKNLSIYIYTYMYVHIIDKPLHNKITRSASL